MLTSELVESICRCVNCCSFYSPCSCRPDKNWGFFYRTDLSATFLCRPTKR